jgi:DNA modification methylase
MKVHHFADGVAICGDCMDPSVVDTVWQIAGQGVPLVIADPPYGGIVNEAWDNIITDGDLALYLRDMTRTYADLVVSGGALYVWGGIGKPGSRAFLRYLVETEQVGSLELANLITWSKKRAYGVRHNYLWTREECAYWVHGDAKKPRTFNVPLLDQKRGYAGYNAKYPAKSEYLRRTNVWTDVTEIFRGKVHPTQKAQRVIEIPIQVHTDPGEYVIDPFAGSGTTGMACRALGRKFILIEQDPVHFDGMLSRLATDSGQ